MNIDALKNEWEELGKEYGELEVSFPRIITQKVQKKIKAKETVKYLKSLKTTHK